MFDGMEGQPASRFNRYVNACSDYSIKPDLASYERGRLKGLESFCTRDNGWSIGSQGMSYQNVCTNQLRAPFMAGYVPGRKLHNADRQVQNIYNVVRYNRNRVTRLEDQITRLQTDLADDDISDTQKDTIRKQIREKRSEISQLRYETTDALGQQPFAIAECRDVRREVERLGFNTGGACE